MSDYGYRPLIFVVDDNEVVRKSIVKRLSRENFAVKDFESGEKVLEALDYETPNLVLLDFQMPKLNGLETVMEMQRKGMLIPVVFLTAHKELLDMSKVKYKGVISLVTKSLELEDVVSVVKIAITDRQSLTF
jgi:FixJ family two-component response regulator